MTQALEAARAGIALSLAFNPVFAAVTAALAAALMSRPGRRGLALSGAFILMAGWLLGDGMRAIAAARTLSDGAGELLPQASAVTNGAAVALWAAGTLVLGYVLPAWAGAFVGRRVTWGTGFIAAIAVSVSVSGAIAVIAGRLGG